MKTQTQQSSPAQIAAEELLLEGCEAFVELHSSAVHEKIERTHTHARSILAPQFRDALLRKERAP